MSMHIRKIFFVKTVQRRRTEVDLSRDDTTIPSTGQLDGSVDTSVTIPFMSVCARRE
jgi:hypothetical protein